MFALLRRSQIGPGLHQLTLEQLDAGTQRLLRLGHAGSREKQ